MENTVVTAPVGQLKTNKGLIKTILLSLITFGIYPLVASICNLTFDPNKERNIGYKKV